MITADLLDAYLEIWARGKLSECSEYRAMWYPRATPEERYARRGMVGSGGPSATTPGYGSEMFTAVDSAVAKLRQSRSPILYSALHQRWLETGPDESRAKRIGLTPEKFKIALGSARRFLRNELDR